MRSVITLLAALALGTGLSVAENGAQGPQQQTRQEQPQRLDQRGGAQTYDAGDQGRNVGKDTQHTYTSGQQAQAIPPRRERRGAGTGVATGFVAAGVGLALLGLFVRRRNRRHPDDPRYDDEHDDDAGPTSPGPRV